ncbi:shikimate kinase [Gordonia sp. (in: high G+C Gram-positive bacteria)]|uniref:shikimate kinase n=1 Tax=Gordonia sp. (in: high G+C Gram-positive bacteria) TaxID=84139 RepID=UPI0039E67CD2
MGNRLGHGPVLVLTGFMGAGKSTIGRAVAQRLGVDFLDTDAELERSAGRSVAEVFAAEGEAGFRELERTIVTSVLAGFPGVVALGGGSVTVPAIRGALEGHRVVHLRITPAVGYARVEQSDRPLLAVDDPHAEYARLLQERTALYEQVATETVDADRAVQDVVDDVLAIVHRPPTDRKGPES